MFLLTHHIRGRSLCLENELGVGGRGCCVERGVVGRGRGRRGGGVAGGRGKVAGMGRGWKVVVVMRRGGRGRRWWVWRGHRHVGGGVEMLLIGHAERRGVYGVIRGNPRHPSGRVLESKPFHIDSAHFQIATT